MIERECCNKGPGSKSKSGGFESDIGSILLRKIGFFFWGGGGGGLGGIQFPIGVTFDW
jgi:hypothetical protein